MIKKRLVPLLVKIEESISTGGCDMANSIYTVSEVALKLIFYTEDVKVILSDVTPLLKSIYEMYFGHEFKT